MKPMTDTERLDWLEENFYLYRFRYFRGEPRMDNSAPPCWHLYAPNYGGTTRATLREAIDAATEEPKP